MRPVVIALLLASDPALAFEFESVASQGCHERLTLGGIAAAGWPAEATVPAQSNLDRSLASALPFNPPAGANLWTLTLLVGARDNDFHGSGLLDLDRLHEVHLGAELQAEHCLRSPSHDGADGDAAALVACKKFISDELALALPEDGNWNATETIPLAVREGQISVQVPRYAFHVGRALHALQDGFSHTLRSPDFSEVLSVFNYVDPALSPSYLPEVDGYRHLSALDKCAGDGGPAYQAAAVATTELLRAITTAGDRTARLQRADAVLATHFQARAICGEDAWCPTAETQLQAELPAPPQSCSQAGGGSAWGLALFALLLRALRLDPKAVRALARHPSVRTGAAVLAVLAYAGAAEAAPSLRPNVFLALSGDRAGAAIGGGARYVLGERLELGLSAEWNPWVELASFKASPGTINASLDAGWAWYLHEGVMVRSVIGAGASVLLYDAAVVGRGSVGPFLRFSAVSVRFPVGSQGAVEVQPELALAIPALGGVPLMYRQYRLLIGFSFGE